MRVLFASLLAASGFVIWVGCGGDSNTTGSGGGNPGSGGGSANGGSTPGSGGSTTTTTTTTDTSSGGNSGTGGTAGTGGGTASGGGAGGPPCPDPSGYYETITTLGAGCGDLNTDAPACVSAANELCRFHLQSGMTGGAIGSVNGGIGLASDGTFMGATIYEGSSPNPRTGCYGTYANGTLKIICGEDPNMPDPTSSQACEVTLTRTRNNCP